MSKQETDLYWSWIEASIKTVVADHETKELLLKNMEKFRSVTPPSLVEMKKRQLIISWPNYKTHIFVNIDEPVFGIQNWSRFLTGQEGIDELIEFLR